MTRPIVQPLTFWFMNGGRTSQPSRALAALQLLAGYAVTPSVACLVEMDEGDKGYSDHANIRTVFRKSDGWFKTWMSKKEPILSHGIKPKRLRGRTRKGCPGVRHKSPARSWQVSVYPTPDGLVAVVVGHLPTHAHNGGPKVPRAERAQMLEIYGQMQAALEKLIADLHAKGYVGVLVAADWNNPHPPQIHHRQVVIAHHGPDRIVAIPNVGRQVIHGAQETHNQPIETFHPIIGAQARFVAA